MVLCHEGGQGGGILVTAGPFGPVQLAEGEGAVGLADEAMGHGACIQLAGDARLDRLFPEAGAEVRVFVHRLEADIVVVEAGAGVPDDLGHEVAGGRR